MSEIIIQPKNPLDLTPEEAEELAKAIRISYPRYKVQVKIDGYKGYAVTLYQVITVAVLAAVTEEIVKQIVKLSVDWARERFKQNRSARTTSIMIYGPKGEVLKSLVVKNATDEPEDRTEEDIGIEEIAKKYRGGRANEFEKKRLGGTAMSKKWQESVEAWAIFLVWVFGLLMATLTVLGTLPALSEPASLILLISLIVFLCASLIVFVFDMRRRWGKPKK